MRVEKITKLNAKILLTKEKRTNVILLAKEKRKNIINIDFRRFDIASSNV